LAPQHVVILPIIHRKEDELAILSHCERLREAIEKVSYDRCPVKVHMDQRDANGGVKKWEWIKKGVPLILEIGPRDVEKNSVSVLRRYTMEQYVLLWDEFVQNLPEELAQIQGGMLERARSFREENTRQITSEGEFEEFFKKQSGYAITFFVGDQKIEESMKEKFNVTIRCILSKKEGENSMGTCAFTGKSTQQKVVWSKSY
jgi:prolyl-tRNA synthetase